jgi:hypothetical protein
MPASSFGLPQWMLQGNNFPLKHNVSQEKAEEVVSSDKSALDKCLLDTALASEQFKLAKAAAQILSPLAMGGRVDERFTLYPLTTNERATASVMVNGIDSYGQLVDSSSRLLRMLPTHHIDSKGELSGYRFSAPSSGPSSVLPINHEMFHGTSAVKCSKHGAGRVNKDAIRLLANLPECQQKMKNLMAAITLEASEALNSDICGVASFDCFPINAECNDNIDSCDSEQISRMRDAKPWICEKPLSIGVYHAYARRFKDVREHCLFIVCSGGCLTACDQFMNFTSELSSCSAATAQELCDSQEVWWLRTLCSRMRGRLINRVAQEFNLPVLTVRDPYACDSNQVMFMSQIETLTHDIQTMRKSSNVSVYNECVNSSTTRNGILCNMNLSEGYWLFKGPPSNCDSSLDYGSVFGSERDCGVFPTSASRLTKEQMTHNMNHGCHVVAETSAAEGFVFSEETSKKDRSNCIKFDEAFLRNLELMGWQRDNGIMEMMPIVVGVF